MSPSMTVLKLEGAAEDWHLHLSGDWSLSAMAQIEAQLSALPDQLQGALVCDWSHAEAPGIGAVWALLMRLGVIGSHRLEVRHSGNPPHFLPLLQKLDADRHAPRAAAAEPSLHRSVGNLGRWAVLQGTEIGRASCRASVDTLLDEE